MKKLVICALPLVLTCVTQVSFAGSHLPQQLHDLSRTLTSISNEKPGDLCSGDLVVAGAYLDAGAFKLERNKMNEALVSLKYGQNELKDISTKRAYCTYFAPKVKPLLAQLIRLSGEIEANQLALSESFIG